MTEVSMYLFMLMACGGALVALIWCAYLSRRLHRLEMLSDGRSEAQRETREQVRELARHFGLSLSWVPTTSARWVVEKREECNDRP